MQSENEDLQHYSVLRDLRCGKVVGESEHGAEGGAEVVQDDLHGLSNMQELCVWSTLVQTWSSQC